MSEEATTRQLVVFSLGDEEYALPIADVHEIIRYTEPRSVASSVRLGPRRHQPARQDRPRLRPRVAARHARAAEDVAEQKIVIVEAAARLAGVVVDDVAEVITVDADQLERLPSADEAAIDAIVKLDDRLIVLLSPAGLFGVAAEIAA